MKLFHLYSKKCTVTCGKCKGDCEDTHPLPYCLKWKDEGRCTNSLQWWMKKRCKRTCGYCNNDNASSTTTTTTTTTPPNCKDKSSNCPYWASIGECKKNPGYMRPNCRVSCNTCLTPPSCTQDQQIHYPLLQHG